MCYKGSKILFSSLNAENDYRLCLLLVFNRYRKLTKNLMKCSYSCETSKKLKKSTPKYTMLRFMISHSKMSDTELFYMQYFSIWFIYNAIFVCSIICSTIFMFSFSLFVFLFPCILCFTLSNEINSNAKVVYQW